MTNPESNEAVALPRLASLADITKWVIGPSGDGSSALRISISVKNFLDVDLIRALSQGQVILSLLPIQMGLPTVVGCTHPMDKRFRYDAASWVCLECGQMYPVQQDDQPSEPAP